MKGIYSNSLFLLNTVALLQQIESFASPRITRIFNQLITNKFQIHRFLSDSDIFDAEEEAAYEAHDLSDPGMEAAAMERAVIMAHEMTKVLKDKVDQHTLMEKVTKDLTATFEDQPDQLNKAIKE
eukprot:878094_1